MNDPIIHAPLSKIVEAIINKQDSILEYYYTSAIIDEHKLTEVLASLGGEESNQPNPSERENEFPKAKDYGYHSSENRTGKAFERGYRIGYAKAKQSEREVLMNYEKWAIENNTPISHNLKEASLNIDRYLAEKHKTEKK